MTPIDQLVQKGFGLVRTVGGQAEKLGRRVVSDATGQVQRVRNSRPEPKDLDDVTLARKVESEAFRNATAAKRTVNVNVVDGRVELRGTAKAQTIAALVARVEAIPEVKEVTNLLHPPKTPSPTRASTPRNQQKPKASTQKKRAQSRKTTTKVTDDKTSRLAENAEPTGAELAAEKKGRQPAPLGNEQAGTSGDSGAADSTKATTTPGAKVEQALEQGPADQSQSKAATIAGGTADEA
jgi:hypothetical protein